MPETLFKSDEFTIWQPACVEIVKGSDENDRKIGGFCSTEDLDRQQEVVLQKGLDFADFIEHGYYNDNHNQATAAIVGIPDSVVFKKGRGWYTEGHLLKGFPRADEIWQLAKSLQGTKRKLGFSIEGKIISRNDKYIERAKIRNVAVTNCFPGDVRVCGAGEAVTRRFYSGPMVTIQLATGELLSGTPNHPVFTNLGWVSLSELDERLHCVGRFSRDAMVTGSSVVTHDVDHVPAELRELFEFARLVPQSHRIYAGGERDFHGDGRNGEVDVVAINGLLRFNAKAAFLQKFGELALPASDKELSFFARLGLGERLRFAGLLPAASFVRGSRELRALSAGAVSVSHEHHFMPSHGDSGFLGGVEDRLSRDPEMLADSGRALSSAVRFSKLVRKRVADFSGHVFNLDSVHGWYEANGIIVHNCPVNTSCTWSVLAKSMMGMETPTKTQEEILESVDALEKDELPKSVYPCEKCEKAFATHKGFEEHLKNVHKQIVETPSEETMKSLRSSKNFDEAGAVELLRRLRPQYSSAACRRIFHYSLNRGA